MTDDFPSQDNYSAALELASKGWAVFPCQWRGDKAKSPLLPHGHLEASRDEALITEWWARWPLAMIGAPVPESLLVLDIDPRNGGALSTLQEACGPLPDTLTVWSGRGDGGRHLYFRRPAGELTATRLPEGIDLKARGYCILPPSIHPASGQPYTWEAREPAVLPRALRELILKPRRVHVGGPTGLTGRAEPLLRLVAGLKDGERNRGLYWAACRAVEDGILADVEAALVAAAVGTGLDEREARRTVQSAVGTR
jgi:hypothetical protein